MKTYQSIFLRFKNVYGFTLLNASFSVDLTMTLRRLHKDLFTQEETLSIILDMLFIDLASLERTCEYIVACPFPYEQTLRHKID